MTGIRRTMMGAAGAAGGDATYVEDVFNAWVETGTGGADNVITNGINLSEEEGIVWKKRRDATGGHQIFDVAQGGDKYLASDSSAAQVSTAELMTFQTTGFTDKNSYAYEDVFWTFRNAPGFFDVVTYTGTGTLPSGTAQTINHNLGSVPGVMMVKEYSAAGNGWRVYHRSLGATKHLVLNETGAAATSATEWNDTTPTSTQFTVGADSNGTNKTGSSYIAYLFAHDAQIFGAGSDESIIKCGSVTTTATWGNFKEDLGWEPQYFLMKRADATGDWFLLDSMRGIVGPGNGTLADTSAFYNLYQTSDDAELKANTSAAETEQGRASLYSQGVIGAFGFGSAELIYIAIRRPMKVSEAGTEVFAPTLGNGPDPAYVSGFPVDMGLDRIFNTTADWDMSSRLTGATRLEPNLFAAEGSQPDCTYDFMNGYRTNGNGINSIAYMFNRGPEFFDVVCYIGTGSAHTEAHNLTVAPEMMIVKDRDAAWNWITYHKALGATKHLYLNTDKVAETGTGYWNDTEPTSSVFTIGTYGQINTSSDAYIAYLFATLAGISKVGSYTADATLTTIDCGFAAGARFIWIKRTDAVGDWYVYDSTSGIVAGNDPYLLTNTDAAQTTGTDYIDPDNSGFQITAAGSSTINVDTGEYIFLAIA